MGILSYGFRVIILRTLNNSLVFLLLYFINEFRTCCISVG